MTNCGQLALQHCSTTNPLSLIETKMKARITAMDFINFLELFNSSDKIEGLQFGDTGYKREGFIEESILNGNHTIEAMLNLNYKFDGLIAFEGKIGEYQIRLDPRMDRSFAFQIESDHKSLRNLEYRILERNAYKPGLFEFEYLKEYDK